MPEPKLENETPHDYIIRNYDIYKNDVGTLALALKEVFGNINHPETINGLAYWTSIASSGLYYCHLQSLKNNQDSSCN